MRRFFIDIPSLKQEELTLPPEESKHACKVLRMTTGDDLEIVNGRGELFSGKILVADSKRCIVKKEKYSFHPKDKYSIHIAIAPTKMNDRIETFLEKTTELGIHEVTPLLCSNSERKKIKHERYNKVIIAAMKQSKRLYLPKLNKLTTFKDFIDANSGLIAHCEEGSKNDITSTLQAQDCPIIIGPEGDFTTQEIEYALKKGFKPVTLGKTRLRTETAGLYACMQAKLKFES